MSPRFHPGRIAVGFCPSAFVAGVCLCISMLRPASSFASTPGFGPPLTLTTGTVYRVGTASGLVAAVDAVNAAGVPATILISNGVYVLDTWALPITSSGVVVRSLGGNRDNVVLRGPDEGPEASLEHVFWVVAPNVTLADLSFGMCRYHGIQAHGQEPYNVAGLWIHNCRIFDCNEQFIKGTSAPDDPEGITDGIIENCLFEFTRGWAYQAYTGGIDIHKGANWIVRDNLFLHLRAADGMAEHAIHFWNRNTLRPQNIVVERNLILHCDRGIGFGLSSFSGGHDGGASAIRNNIVYNDGAGPYTDVGIGLEYACNVHVDNNTVHVPYWAPVEYRFSGSSNLAFRNNLVNRPLTARDGAPAPVLAANLLYPATNAFRDLPAGDLRLILPDASLALDQGIALPGFADDAFGNLRPAGAAWDVGAHEYDPVSTDSDGDRLNDWAEEQAGTDPRNPASVLALLDPRSAPDGSGIFRWPSATGRRYALSRSTNLAEGLWNPVAANLPATVPMNTYTDSTVFAPMTFFYRVQVDGSPRSPDRLTAPDARAPQTCPAPPAPGSCRSSSRPFPAGR